MEVKFLTKMIYIYQSYQKQLQDNAKETTKTVGLCLTSLVLESNLSIYRKIQVKL